MLCFIVSLVVGACIFLGVFYLVKSEIIDLYDQFEFIELNKEV